MSDETLRLLLASAGAGCQIVGFTWALVDASLARGREFGEYGLPRRIGRRIWNWFVFWLGPAPEPPQFTGTFKATSGFSAVMSPVKSPESETERLGRELGELSATVERYREDADERLATVQSDVRKLHDELTARISGIETREHERRRGPLRREQRAAQLFIVGAFLTTSTYLV